MTTPMQEAAALLIGVTADPTDQATFDQGLDDLLRAARQVFADLGPAYGREQMARVLHSAGSDYRTSHLLSAALLRLTDWRDG